MMTAVTYGVYSALAAIAVTLLEYFTGMDRTPAGRWLGMIGFVVMIIMIVMAIKERKNEEFGGRISYGQGVGTGMIVALTSSFIVAIFMYFYMTQINPDILTYMQEQARQNMPANMPPEQMEASLRMARSFMTPGMQTLFALLGGTLIGLIISLIVSIFTRTKEEEQIRMA